MTPATAVKTEACCADTWCQASLSETDLSLGICPKCGAMLPLSVVNGAEKIEKTGAVSENSGR